MKLSLISLLLVAAGHLFGQHQQNPRLYYRHIHSESVQLQQKDLAFRRACLREEAPAVAEKLRTNLEDDLRENLKKSKEIPAFRGDSSLVMAYTEMLDSLLTVYTNLWPQGLPPSAYEKLNYANILQRCRLQQKAETKATEAFARFREAEEEFASARDMGLKPEIDIAKQQQLLDKLGPHLRSHSLIFYSLHQAILSFADSIAKYPSQNLDSFLLPQQVRELQLQLEDEKTRTESIGSRGMGKDLNQALNRYLQSLDREIQKKLVPIAETLSTQAFYTNEHRDARIDLGFFMQDYASISQRFMQERLAFQRNYLPLK